MREEVKEIMHCMVFDMNAINDLLRVVIWQCTRGPGQSPKRNLHFHRRGRESRFGFVSRINQ